MPSFPILTEGPFLFWRAYQHYTKCVVSIITVLLLFSFSCYRNIGMYMTALLKFHVPVQKCRFEWKSKLTRTRPAYTNGQIQRQHRIVRSNLFTTVIVSTRLFTVVLSTGKCLCLFLRKVIARSCVLALPPPRVTVCNEY